MDPALKRDFAELWGRHFPGSELPLAFFFSDDPGVEIARPPRGWRCFVAALAPVRRGRPLAFGADSLGCDGVRQYAGFSPERSDDLALFLSCGAPGGRPGLRLKRTPELVRAAHAGAPRIAAGGRYLVAKRWDRLDERDEPAVIAFFVRPDALSALVALASFDRPDDDGTASPSVAGCASLFARPYAERGAERPRCFAGLFDLTPRRWVRPDELTFSMPFGRFRQLVQALPRSLVVTRQWKDVARRAARVHG